MAGMIGGSMGAGGLSQSQADALYIRKNISSDEIATSSGGTWRFKRADNAAPTIRAENNAGTRRTNINISDILLKDDTSGLFSEFNEFGFGAAGDASLVTLNPWLVTDLPTGNNGGFFLQTTSAFLQVIGVPLQITAAGLTFVDNGIGTDFANLIVSSPPTPAQVGLPTASAGIAANLNRSDHRHAFSGRFSIDGFLATAVLAGLPSKFARFKIANTFTVRRISVYALAGPTGGTESFGIVNAAGTLQGTAVVLPAGPAATEAEAAQTTNLSGGTVYYLAETASAVGVTVPAANVMLVVEYTMNI